MTSCLVPNCPLLAVTTTEVALCADHLAVAVEAAAPATDAMPTPCLLCGHRLGVRYPSGWMCGICEWPHAEHPDGELPPPRVDVVYYLRHGDRVKIGTTANPRQRFAAIWHEEVLAFERGNRRLEQARHRQFATIRAGSSEWFDLAPELAAHIEVLAGGVDPWDRWALWVAEATAAR